MWELSACNTACHVGEKQRILGGGIVKVDPDVVEWKINIDNRRSRHNWSNNIQRIEFGIVFYTRRSGRSSLGLYDAGNGIADFERHVSGNIGGSGKGQLERTRRWQHKVLGHLSLDEQGGALVPTIRILVEDGGVVLLGIFTALHDGLDQGAQLSPCVTRVVHVSRRLKNVSGKLKLREKRDIPSRPS